MKTKICIRRILGPIRLTNRPQISTRQIFLLFSKLAKISEVTIQKKSKKNWLAEISGRLVGRRSPKIGRMEMLAFMESTSNFLIITTKNKLTLIIQT